MQTSRRTIEGSPGAGRRHRINNAKTRRAVKGIFAALASTTVLTAALLPLRDHLSVATTALVLIIPVVVGVATGGFLAGAISVISGFLVFDYFFIPPYWTLQIGATENWIALLVYAVVTLPVARLVARVIAARTQAEQRGVELRRLLDVSTVLIEDRPLEEVLTMVAATLRELYEARQVALLLPHGQRLEIVASAGSPLTNAERDSVQLALGRLSSLVTQTAGRNEPFTLALVATGRPVGLLAITGAKITEQQRELLRLFANQAALAVERAQLREKALRAALTDEVERLAAMLVAAVSHDLRSPLASIKAASSTLADPQLAARIDPENRHKLASLIDAQADRLAGLVTNLLDMGRIQAGALQPQLCPASVTDLVHTADSSVIRSRQAPATQLDLPAGLPLVDVDSTLIVRVLVNLLDNAYRHSPKNSDVRVTAEHTSPGIVTIRVSDNGPGVSEDKRSEIFGLYTRRSNDSGTGLGLTIAKTFIDAHHQTIWVESEPGSGARFCFTLPTAAPPTTSLSAAPSVGC